MELAPIFTVILFALFALLWLAAIIDLFRNNFKKPSRNFMWFWIVLLFPVFGSLIYFLMKNKTRKKEFNPQFNK